MKIISKLCIFLVFLTLASILVSLVIPLLFRPPKELPVPDSGCWFCEDLEIQLSFDETDSTYAVINGIEKNCVILRENNTNTIIVFCADWETCSLSHDCKIFSGSILELTNTEFLLMESKSKVVYSFEKR